jgi:hypothetical protein
VDPDPVGARTFGLSGLDPKQNVITGVPTDQCPGPLYFHPDPDHALFSRVVDPYSFFTDPDPEFDVGDQYGSGSGSNPIRIQGFNDQKLKKNYS